jgi:mannose-6-phosphate isomerase-like protein (cupin superfamily)
VQQQDPEVVVGLSGRGRATVNDEPFSLSPGDVVHVPLGSVLTIENLGDDALGYLIIKARG